jgi:hypothetical protein
MTPPRDKASRYVPGDRVTAVKSGKTGMVVAAYKKSSWLDAFAGHKWDSDSYSYIVLCDGSAELVGPVFASELSDSSFVPTQDTRNDTLTR